MYSYAVVTFFDGCIDYIECVSGKRKGDAYENAQQIMVQNFLNEVLNVCSPSEISNYLQDTSEILSEDCIAIEDDRYQICTRIFPTIINSGDIQHKLTHNRMLQREVYAVQNRFTGELFFNAHGGTYKSLDDAMKKRAKLTKEQGDLFKIVTYELKE